MSRPSSRFSPSSISKLSRFLLAASAAVLLGACATQMAAEAPEGVAPDRTLRVVTYNVGGAVSGPTPPELVAGVLEGTPRADIYLLQEIWSREHLGGIAAALSPTHHAAYAPSLRTGILSAAPLSDCRVFHPRGASSKYGTFRCEVASFAVAGVHLDPIDKERTESGFVRMGFVRSAGAVLREALTSTPRSRAAREIETWLSSWDDERVIVAGDFNTVPFTRTIRRMNRHFEEVLRGTGDYLDGTYWKVDGRILPRIDFIFYAGALERLDGRIIEEQAGDHYPVVAEFLLR